MDPIQSITVKKDSSLAMLLAAQRRGWSLRYMEPPDLFLDGFVARARARELRVMDDPGGWYEFGEQSELSLGELDVILMRRDPPFDMDYIYATYVLEFAEAPVNFHAIRDAVGNRYRDGWEAEEDHRHEVHQSMSIIGG